MTLLELIISCAILLVLASAALPIARYTMWHQKERQLRYNLQMMRDAIDHYNEAFLQQKIKADASTQGYPPDLETLVKGVPLVTGAGQGTGVTPAAGLTPAAGAAAQGSGATTQGTSGDVTIRFLRKIPIDPMTGKADWGLRAVGDDYDSRSWGGKNVFDIYSTSPATAIDGTRYSDW